MIALKHPGLLVLIVAFAAADAAPSGPIGTVAPVAVETSKQLMYESFDASSDDWSAPSAGAGTVHPKANMVTVRSGEVTVAAAIDADAPDSSMANVLRLDFTGKGRFGDAPTVPLDFRSGRTSARFGPTIVTVQRDGVSLPVAVQGYYHRHTRSRCFSLSVQTAREGVCSFGGKPRRIRLVDCTNDLTVNTPVRFGSKKGRPVIAAHGDTLLVDRGGGTFSSETSTKTMIGQPVRVDDRWYVVKVSKDQTKVTAAALEEPTGMLHVDQGLWWVRLLSANRLVVCSGGREPVSVPAGAYEIISGGQEYGAPREGTVLLDNDGVKPVTVRVDAGKTTALTFGTPIQLHVKTKVQGRQVTMDLLQRDSSGLNVDALVTGADRMPPRRPPPSLKVMDADGKVVHTGVFEFG